MKDLYGLLDVIHDAYSRPEYTPQPDGKTFCNKFTSEVVTNLGFKGLEGLLANEIISTLIARTEQWSEVPMEKVQDLANQGSLVVAGTHGEPHGHVCIVCPGKQRSSARWTTVPVVASVGSQNMIRGANWVFSTFPRFWTYRPSL